jgi:hypothetical protein
MQWGVRAMMMDWDRLCETYGLVERVTGLLHCGAHLAEEAPAYDQAFGSDVPVWWVEGKPQCSPRSRGL